MIREFGLVRRALATLLVGLSAASAERVVPLHAPIAALSRDGKTVYTKALSDWGAVVVEAYHLNTRQQEVVVLRPPQDSQITLQDVFDHADPVQGSGVPSNQLSLSPNGRQIIVRQDGTRSFDSMSFRPLAANPTYPPIGTGVSPRLDLSFAPDSSSLLWYTGDTLIILGLPRFNVISHVDVKTPTYFVNYIKYGSMGLSPSGTRLIISGQRKFQIFHFDVNHPPHTLEQLNRAVIYDNTAPSAAKQHDFGQPGAAAGISFSPDGSVVASGFVSEQREAPFDYSQDYGRVRNLNTGQVVYKLTGQRTAIIQTAFSPNGRYLATLGDTVNNAGLCNSYADTSDQPRSPYGDGTVHLRDARTGKTLKVFAHACDGLLFSRDNKKLMYSDRLYNLHIIDLP